MTSVREDDKSFRRTREDKYDRPREQEDYDARSRRRYQSEFHGHRHAEEDVNHSRRRPGEDDSSHGRRRHGRDADEEEFEGVGRSRQYRHHEVSDRDMLPRRGREKASSVRSSDYGGRDGADDGHPGHRGETIPRKDYSVDHHRDVDKDFRSGHFSARGKDAHKSEDTLPELFSIHRARVQSVRPFGVFVRLEGFHKQGLIHISQLSDHEVTDREDSDEVKMKAIAAVAGEGDQVWVKVISVKDDAGTVKIGCSLKLVSQSTGKDLDPNNIRLEQQQSRGNRQEIKKVTLDAIYNVTCSRCGGHGHLKAECYGMVNKAYDLIPEAAADFSDLLEQPRKAQSPLEEAHVKPGFGRGRAMVLPAWMTHGSGATAVSQLGSLEPKRKRKSRELPDKISTVEEAMAIIAEAKKEKKERHARKKHKKHKKDKKSKKLSSKKCSYKDGDESKKR